MSELKAYRIKGVTLGDFHDVYLKSEADKVIAELKDKLQNVSELLNETREWLIESQKLHKRCADNAIKIIRHHKYKRCFAMARLCEEKCRDMENAVIKLGVYPYMSTCPTDCDTRYEFLKRWSLRWHKIAEKFKEAK